MRRVFSQTVNRVKFALAGALMLLQVAMPMVTFATPAPGPNDVAYWCGNFDGGVKFDDDTTGVEVGEHTIAPVTLTIGENANEKTVVTDVEGNGVVITKVVVKGGNNGGDGNGNLAYTPAFSFPLVAPNNNGGQQADVSHVIVCYDEVDKGNLEVKKKVDLNDGNGYVADNPSQHGFVWGLDNETPGRAMGTTINNLQVGSYSISENSVSGFQFTGWYYTTSDVKSCSNPESTSMPTVTVYKNQTRRVTLCNKKVNEKPETGSVKVHKRVDTNGDNVYDGLNVGVSAFKWGLDGATPDRVMGFDGWLKDVPVGEHTVNENSVTDYTFKGWYYEEDKDYSCTSPRGTTLPASITVTKDTITHVVLCNQKNPTPPVDFCSTTDVTGSVSSWIARNGRNHGGECFDYSVTPECRVVNGSVTKQVTPQYPQGPFRLVWREGTETTTGYKDFPATFPEDYNNGSVQITYFMVGPEKDWLLGSGLPNFWDGNGKTITVDTNCDDPEPEPENGDVFGHKFNDANGNGQYDEGEEFLSGFTIELYNACVVSIETVLNAARTTEGCVEELIASDVTDENGLFEFSGIEAGSYYVCEVQQDGWVQTLPSDNACWFIEDKDFRQGDCEVDFGNKAKTPGEVLGEKTPTPQVLANTGSSFSYGIIAALSIIGGAAAVATRRQRETNTI